MYICMHICMNVCMHACMYVCMLTPQRLSYWKTLAGEISVEKIRGNHLSSTTCPTQVFLERGE